MSDKNLESPALQHVMSKGKTSQTVELLIKISFFFFPDRNNNC